VSMTLYVIAYDVRAKNHEYQSLYDQLNEWGAAHLQNSVWLADLNGTAAAVRDSLRRHMHPDDTVCVIQIFSNSGWATWAARKTGTDWLKSHMS
jgi:CRISPR/Cas system-associated endoribonuclease Cas2